MSTWIADDAVIFGDVQFGEECSVYYHTVIRTEGGTIVIGDGSNIQDNCVVHGPVHIGKDVTIGHSCIIHGCTIEDNSLIGMGSIIMDNARIGKNCIIGAGSLVTEGTVVPDGHLAFGRPAKVIRPLREEEIRQNQESAKWYIEIKDMHAKQ